MFWLVIRKSQIWKTIVCFVLILALTASILFHISAPTAAHPDTGISVPILMYHSLLKDSKKWGDYILSPDSLEQDMIFLKNHGYATVTITDLIEYVYHGNPLPEKPVILTFDDGHYNNLTYLYPLLVKYDMKAVISVVGAYSEQFSQTPDPNPNYAYLSWDDIKTLASSGRVEIQNHTYNMHHQEERKGAKKKRGESEEEYRKALTKDITKLQNILTNQCGITPNAFTYPYGAVSKDSLPIIKELGFLASLSCYEHENRITRDPDCLYQLNRYNRPSGISTEAFMKKAGIR